MAIPTHITVTAPDGRKTPIHADDGSEPGNGQLFAEPGKVCRVRFSQTIRRALARGDLSMCNMDGSVVDSANAAAAPRDIGPPFLIADRKAAKNGGAQ